MLEKGSLFTGTLDLYTIYLPCKFHICKSNQFDHGMPFRPFEEERNNIQDKNNRNPALLVLGTITEYPENHLASQRLRITDLYNDPWDVFRQQMVVYKMVAAL